MANQNLLDSWNLVTSGLSKDFVGNQRLVDAFIVLKKNDFLSHYKDWYFETFRDLVSHKLIPTFWSKLPREALPDDLTAIIQSDFPLNRSKAHLMLIDAVGYLYEEVSKYMRTTGFDVYVANVEKENSYGFQQQLKQILQSAILSKIELYLNDYILFTYYGGFCLSRYLRSQEKREMAYDGVLCDDEYDSEPESALETRCKLCDGLVKSSYENTATVEQLVQHRIQEETTEFCSCPLTMKMFLDLNNHLQQLGLLDVLCEDAVSSVTHSFIERKIKEKCQGNFDVSCLRPLEQWVRITVVGWLDIVYNKDNRQSTKNTEERLIHFMYETYAQIRTDQMFDIIVEYPESEPALEDLKECLQKCHGYRKKVIKSLKDSFESRLLHPGVATNDILTAYIQAIKSLRVLDHSGVILQLVCDPVKKYLKTREDTVRCIITALTDENSELIPELVKGAAQPLEEGNCPSDDEYIVENWQKWEPDPVDAPSASLSSKSIRSSDIVSILVNIYESKDLFVEEYQRLLAQRFLSNFECNVDLERRNLELLTLRFGESDLHACEVMLTDMTTSKRIDNRINAGEIESFHFRKFPIKCLVLSEQFWPEKLGLPASDEANKIKLPSEVDEAVETYTKAFETIKPSRTLNWTPYLGSAEIELEFKDRKLTFTVSPIHVAIIWQFQEKKTWLISDLSQAISVPTQILRRKISLWQNKGILKEVQPDKFVLIEDLVEGVPSENEKMNVEEEFCSFEEDGSDAGYQAGQQRAVDEERFRVYWSFIENMLTNLNSLPLERIHTMLQMFALQGTNSSELTVPALRHFLDSKVKEQKLIFSGGQYRLP